MDWSVFLSALAVIASSLSAYASIKAPMKIEKQRQEHELLMYEKRFVKEHYATVVENYVKAAGRLISEFNDQDYGNYAASYGEILLYVRSAIRDNIIHLNSYISGVMNRDYYSDGKEYEKVRSRIFNDFNTICEYLSDLEPRKPIVKKEAN